MMNIGMKIQKGGGRYIKDEVSFILFDVKIDKWWLRRPDIEEIAGDLAIKVVPVIGYMTFEEAIEYVSNGYKSLIAEDTTYALNGIWIAMPVSDTIATAITLLLLWRTDKKLQNKNSVITR